MDARNVSRELLLRSTLQRDNRQVLSTFVEVDLQSELVARLSGDQRLRLGTRGTTWPMFARLDARLLVGWSVLEVDFVRRLAGQCHVRSMFVEPITKQN